MAMSIVLAWSTAAPGVAAQQPPTDRAIILIAGDIAAKGADTGHAATARLIERRQGVVMTAGDNAYPRGTYKQFRFRYDPTWGRFLDRTRPVPGNHEYLTRGAAGYFRYFGRRAGPHGRGYYTFKVGAWRVFALDSEQCLMKVGCGPGSPQYRWLKRELARSQARCQLAVWHHPRFSSGSHGNGPAVRPLARLIYGAGAELVVNAHDHLYERMAPARPNGSPDPLGVRQFIVGTGGAPLHGLGTPAPMSEVVDASTWGILRLRLRKDSYEWRFIPVAGSAFTDSGSGSCHDSPR